MVHYQIQMFFWLAECQTKLYLRKQKNDKMTTVNLSDFNAMINVSYDKHCNGFCQFIRK